jgi:hypothetical protein
MAAFSCPAVLDSARGGENACHSATNLTAFGERPAEVVVAEALSVGRAPCLALALPEEAVIS